jgi:hypothetical protein
MPYNQLQPQQFAQPAFQPIQMNGLAPPPYPMQPPNIQMQM